MGLSAFRKMQYTVQSPFSVRSWRQTNGQESGGSLFLSMFNALPSKEGEGERKRGFEYPLLRKTAQVEHLPQRDLPL